MTLETFKARNHTLKPLSVIDKVRWTYTVFGKFDIWDVVPYSWQHHWYHTIKPFFKPQNKRLKNIFPNSWADISCLIEKINFEFVKKFYEEEYIDGIVDWEKSGEHHVEFAKWLEAAYQYITVERPKLEKELDEAYPPSPPIEDMFIPHEYKEDGTVKSYKMKDREQSYEELYGEVNRIEQLIVDKDTEVLVEIVKRRQYFWT